MNNARFALCHVSSRSCSGNEPISRYAGGSGNSDWEAGQADDCRATVCQSEESLATLQQRSDDAAHRVEQTIESCVLLPSPSRLGAHRAYPWPADRKSVV